MGRKVKRNKLLDATKFVCTKCRDLGYTHFVRKRQRVQRVCVYCVMGYNWAFRHQLQGDSRMPVVKPKVEQTIDVVGL